MLDLLRRAPGRERDLAVELWRWLFNPGERAAIRAIPGVEELRDLAPPRTPGVASWRRAAVLTAADDRLRPIRARGRISMPTAPARLHMHRAGSRTSKPGAATGELRALGGSPGRARRGRVCPKAATACGCSRLEITAAP